LCDVDNDGDREIAFGAWDQRIYLLDHNGNSLWNNQPNNYPGPGYFNADTIWSSPACADLNGDGDDEIITGADIAGGGTLPDGYQPSDGGFLYIFEGNGDVLARRQLPEVIFSSPVVGDLDGDGTLEVVVGTGWFYWEAHGRVDQPYVYAFDTSQVFSNLHYSDPTKLPHLPGWPRPTHYPGFSSPSLADLDGDGDLEVVIASGFPDGASPECSASPSDPNCYGALYAWHHSGQEVSGFPVWPRDSANKNARMRSTPTIADIDNDGQLEILIPVLWDVAVIGSTGQQENTLRSTWTTVTSPAIGDTDGDNQLEVWIGSANLDERDHGYLWRFESSEVGIGEMPWPMFRRSSENRGFYGPPPEFDFSPPVAFYEPDSGDTATSTLLLSHSGDSSVQWTVVESPRGVEMTTDEGTIPPDLEIPVLLEIDTDHVRNLREGVNSLGDIVVSGVDNGTGEELASVAIPVKLYVGDVHSQFLPALLLLGQSRVLSGLPIDYRDHHSRLP
ncbi:MAG: VCBS repeat-containing protein, partial [Chloroflexota bacterium]|nr:VCBS repeat-containing protein [Chloroflexota bacterium]